MNMFSRFIRNGFFPSHNVFSPINPGLREMIEVIRSLIVS